MNLRFVFLDDVGYLDDSLLELQEVADNLFVLKDAPLSIRTRIDIYEMLHHCYLCYNYDLLLSKNVPVSEEHVVSLHDNGNGTYSHLDKEQVKIYHPASSNRFTKRQIK